MSPITYILAFTCIVSAFPVAINPVRKGVVSTHSVHRESPSRFPKNKPNRKTQSKNNQRFPDNLESPNFFNMKKDVI